ncbi:MAG: septum formation initiator family protein [Eubacteriales bacterium]
MKLITAGIWTRVVIVSTMVYLVTMLMSVSSELQETQAVSDQLQTQVEAMTETNDKMSYALANKDDPDMLEQVARERGYIKVGETLYIDMAG